jgi:hypothetical protein
MNQTRGDLSAQARILGALERLAKGSIRRDILPCEKFDDSGTVKTGRDSVGDAHLFEGCNDIGG